MSEPRALHSLQCAARDLQDEITQHAQTLPGTDPIKSMRLHEIAILQQAVADRLLAEMPAPELPPASSVWP